MNRDIQLWTDRLAEEGYAAIAVDLYRGRSAERVEDALLLRAEANERFEENEAIICGAYEFLASDPRSKSSRRALVGWSYGAGWALTAAHQLPDVSGVVAHYGAANPDPEIVAKIQAPVLLISGSRDEVTEDVTEFANVLKATGRCVDLVLVPADHWIH